MPPSNATPERTRLEATAQTTAKKIGLFDIPLELREIIFDLAYPAAEGVPAVEGFGIMSKAHWAENEFRSRMRDDAHIVRPFPQPKALEFMVSKDFFEAASRAWIGNQWFQGHGPPAMPRPDGCYIDDTLLCRLARNLIWKGPRYSLDLHCYASVKNIRVIVGVESFQTASSSKYSWEEVYDDEDIETTEAYNNTIELYGLLTFEASPARIRSRDSAKSELDIWQANVKRFEELVKPHVLRQRETRTNEQSPTPNYRPQVESTRAEAEWDSQDHISNETTTDEPFDDHPTLEDQVMDLTEADLTFMSKALQFRSKNILYAKSFQHEDIPDSKEDLFDLVIGDPGGFASWVFAAKKQLLEAGARGHRVEIPKKSQESKPLEQPAAAHKVTKPTEKAEQKQQPTPLHQIPKESEESKVLQLPAQARKATEPAKMFEQVHLPVPLRQIFKVGQKSNPLHQFAPARKVTKPTEKAKHKHQPAAAGQIPRESDETKPWHRLATARKLTMPAEKTEQLYQPSPTVKANEKAEESDGEQYLSITDAVAVLVVIAALRYILLEIVLA